MNSWMPRDRRSLRSTGLAGAVACLPFGCAIQADGPLVEPPLPALSIETGTASARSIDPSLTDGFDRSGWPRTIIEVPSGSVAHQPTYVGRPLPPSNAPATAEAALAAVDADPDRSAGDLRDLVIAPGEAVVDLILAPVRMVRTPPWRTVYGPQNDPGLLPGTPREPRPTTEDRP